MNNQSILRIGDIVRNVFLLLTMLWFSGIALNAQRRIDSIQQQISTAETDTLKVRLWNRLSEALLERSADSAKKASLQALSLAKKIQWNEGIGISYHRLAMTYEAENNFVKCFDYYGKAIKVWEKSIKETKGKRKARFLGLKATTLNNLGLVHRHQGNFPKALKIHLQSLKISEQLKDKRAIALAYGNIGIVYDDQGEKKKALEYYEKALLKEKELKNRIGIARNYGNMGVVYDQLGEPDKAMNMYRMALEIDVKSGNKEGISRHVGNIGGIFLQRNEFDSALAYIFEALEIDSGRKNFAGAARHLGNIGVVYGMKGDMNRCEKYLSRGYSLADSVNLKYEKMQFGLMLSQIYQERKDYKRSLEYHLSATEIKDSLFNAEKNSEITRHELNYAFEKREANLNAEHEKKAALDQADKKRQEVVIWLVSGGLVLMAVLALIIFRNLRLTRRQKEMIEEQKHQVEKQKELIEVKQKEILDSIRYARRIQSALLPGEKYIQSKIKSRQ